MISYSNICYIIQVSQEGETFRTPTRIRRNRNSISHTEDISFVSNIGENLLQQCRRSKAELDEKELELKTLKQDHEQLKSENASLESKIKSMATESGMLLISLQNYLIRTNFFFIWNSEKLREENWDLEVKIQSLSDENEKSSLVLNRTHKEKGKLQTDRNEQLELIDSLKLKESSLTKEMERLRSTHDAQISSYKKYHEELKQENAALEQQVTDYKQSVSSLQALVHTKSQQLSKTNDLIHHQQSVDDEAMLDRFDEELDDLGPGLTTSPSFKNSQLSAAALENETTKGSLQHAHRIISQQRAQLSREKLENAELKRLLNNMQEDLEQYRSPDTRLISNISPTNSKMTKNAPLVSQSVLLKTADSSILHKNEHQNNFSQSELDRTGEQLSDEDYTSDDEMYDNNQTPSIFSTFTRSIYGDDNSRAPGNDPYNSSSSDSDMTSDEEDNNPFARHRRRSGSSRGLVGHGLYNRNHNISHESSAPATPRNMALEYISMQEIEQCASEHGLVTITAEEYEKLMNRASVENLTQSSSPVSLNIKGSADGDTVRLVEPATPINQIGHKMDQSFTPFEQAKLSNQQLEQLAAERGLHILPEAEYQTFISKTTESIAQDSYSNQQLKPSASAFISTPSSSKPSGASSTNEQEPQQHTHIISPSSIQEPTPASRSLLGPDLSSLTTSPDEKDKHLKPSAETLTYENVFEKAKELGIVPLSADEYKSLSEKVENPTIEELSKAAKQKNYTVVSQEYFDELKSNLESPSPEYIITKAKSHNLIVIPETEANELRRASQKPTPDEIKSKAGELGLVAISSEKLKELESPTSETIMEHATRLNLRAIPDDYYNDLLRKSTKPSIDETIAFAKLHDLQTTNSSEHSEILRSLNKPTEEELSERAKHLGLTVIPVADLSELKRLAKSPTHKEIEDYATQVGLITLTSDEYRELVRAAENPTAAELKLNAEKSNFTLVSNDDYNTLKELAQTPKAENIKQAAKDTGLIALDKNDYDQLYKDAYTPSEESVKKHALSYGFVPVSKADFDELERKSTKPSSTELEGFAAAAGLVVLDKDNHESLVRALESPTSEELEQKAHDLGLELIEKAKLETLIKDATQPSKEHIMSMASKLDLIAVPIEDHQKLHDLANNPTEEHISTKAAELQLLAIKTSEYNELQRQVASPTKDEVESKAKDLGLVTLPKAEVDELRREPTEAEASETVKKFGLIAVPVDEYELVLEKAERPIDEPFVKSVAASLGLATIATATLETLKKPQPPTLEEIGSLAKKEGYCIIPSTELETLKKPQPPLPASELPSFAKKHGMVALQQKEYEELSKPYSPTMKEVEEIAQTHGYEVLSNAEVESLRDPTLDALKNLLVKHENTCLPIKTLKSLENPDKESISVHAKALNMVVLDSNELEELTRKSSKPTAEELSAFAALSGNVVIPSEEYTRLNETFEHPTVEKVSKLAQSLDLITLSIDELSALQKRADSRSVNEIKKYAAKHGSVLVPKDEYESTLKKATNPPKEDVESFASKLNLSVIDTTKLNALENRVKKPTVEDLANDAGHLGYIVLSDTEYKQLTDKLETPNVNYLSEKANEQGFNLVSVDDHNKLNARATEPPLDLVINHAAKHDHKVIPNQEYNELISNATAPPFDLLSKHADSHGCVVVPADEFQSLTESLKAPSFDTIVDHAKAHGHVVIPSADYEELNSKALTPSLDLISKQADAHQCVVLPVEQYNELKSRATAPSIDSISRDAESHGQIVISVKEFEHLVSESKSISTVDGLTSHAKKLGLVVLPESEFEANENIASELSYLKLSEYATKHNSVLLKKLEYESLISPSKEEIEKHAVGLGCAVVSIDALRALKRRADEPSKEDLEHHSAAHGYSLVPLDEFDILQRKAEEPSINEIDEAASKYNMALIPTDELEDWKRRLTKPTSVELGELSKTVGYVAVPADEFDVLEQTSLEPSREFILQHCKRLGLVGIPYDDYEDLQKRGKDMAKPELESLANKLGFILVTKEEYANMEGGSQRGNIPEIIVQGETGSSSAKPIGSVLRRKAQFEDIIRQSSSPVSSSHGEKVIESMRSLGFVPVASDEYKRLVDNQKEYKPTRRDVLRTAKDFGLVAIPADEYQALLKRNKPVGNSSGGYPVDMLAVDDLLRSRPNSPLSLKGVPRSVSSSKHLSVSTLPGSEDDIDVETVPSQYLASLRQIAESPTPGDVTMLAKKIGLVVLPEATVLGNNSPDEAANSASSAIISESNGYLAISVDEYRNLISKQKEEKEEKVKSIARDMESEEKNQTLPVVLPLSKQRRSSSPDFHDALESPEDALSNDIDVSEDSPSMDSPSNLQKVANNEESIRDAAKSFGLVVLSSVEMQGIQNNVSETLRALEISKLEARSLEESRSNLSKRLEEQEAQTAKRLEEQEAQNAKSVSSTQAEAVRAIQLAKAAAEEAEAEASRIIEETKAAGAHSIQQAEEKIKALQQQVTDLEKKLKSDSEDQLLLKKRAEERGCVLQKEEHDTTKRSSQTSESMLSICAPISSLNTSPDSMTGYISPITPISPATNDPTILDHISAAVKKGYVVISQKEHANLLNASKKAIAMATQPEVSAEELQSRAESMGLHIINDADYKALQAQNSKNEYLDNDSLEASAQRLGMSVLPEKEYEYLLTLKEQNNDKEFVKVPVAKYNDLTAREKTPEVTKDSLKTFAEKLGLVTVPLAEYEELKKSRNTLPHTQEHDNKENDGSNKDNTSNINSGISTPTRFGQPQQFDLGFPNDEYSTQFHFANSPRNSAASSSRFSAISQPLTSLLPAVAAIGTSSVSDYPISATIASCTSPVLDPSKKRSTTTTDSPSQSLPISSLLPISSINERNISSANDTANPFADGLMNISALGMGRNSIIDRTMIQHLTQVVIGEYLYKYTRRFGMNGISENRHQRYFWVHPYTMTLYWSMDNPALDAKSNGKSKSIAIVSVSSIEDSNPLPPGLCHRSLIIKSSDRSIRITCPNPQRHNIWMMSLQYLLERSNDVARDQTESGDSYSITDDYLEDARTTRERERSRRVTSTAFQSPRRSNTRMSTIRHSIAPDLNVRRPSVRQKPQLTTPIKSQSSPTSSQPARQPSIVSPINPRFSESTTRTNTSSPELSFLPRLNVLNSPKNA